MKSSFQNIKKSKKLHKFSALRTELLELHIHFEELLLTKLISLLSAIFSYSSFLYWRCNLAKSDLGI